MRKFLALLKGIVSSAVAICSGYVAYTALSFLTTVIEQTSGDPISRNIGIYSFLSLMSLLSLGVAIMTTLLGVTYLRSVFTAQ